MYSIERHRVFISYHHNYDQNYKDQLISLNNQYDLFINDSVDTGDISDNLDDNRIREKIRDEYLQKSTVTIVLVGTETKNRKHVDWEIAASMRDGRINKRSGILVVNLPSINCNNYTAAHGDEEKRIFYSGNSNWISITSRIEYESRYPYMPARLIDNLLKKEAKISVINWDKIISNIDSLIWLIDITYKDRVICEYDQSRPLRRANR